MSAEKNNLNSASQKEALSKNSDTVQGDIYVQDVHKYFGVTRALNGVNFSANFGEIHAIVGGNGCGKSTLAKVMSGVLPTDKGKVSVMGHTPTSPVMARNLGIATVFQEVMMRTLQGQGPRIQSILVGPATKNFDEIKAILNEDCDRNSTGWDNPGMEKWAPRSYVEAFFDNPSDPEKYDISSH